jgi:predicted metal-dependent peptidase
LPKPKVQETALERVRRIRAALLEDQPFYGFLALRLKLEEDPTCETMWTDGVSLGYNPEFVMEITEVELKGVVCHEVLHVVGKHPWRQEHREHERWNEACDYAVNPIVRASRYVLPHGVLFDEKYIGWSAEAIYRDLQQQKQQEQEQEKAPQQGGSGDEEADQGAGQPSEDGDQSEGSGAPGGKPSPGKGAKGKNSGSGDTEGEGSSGEAPSKGAKGRPRAGEVRKAPSSTEDPASEHSEQGWALAIQSAIVAHGTLPLGLQRYIQAAQKNKVAWEEVLRDFFERANSSPDYTWRTPSMRFVSQGLYMPRLEGLQLPPFVFAIDTSGSMPDDDVAQAQAEMQAIMDEFNPEVLYVLYCDAAVVSAKAFYAGDTIDLQPKGGGGTDFRPVFAWLKEHAPEAAGVVYVTDMMGTFPEAQDVEVPTLWVATSNTPDFRVHSPAPFGTVVQIPAS